MSRRPASAALALVSAVALMILPGASPVGAQAGGGCPEPSDTPQAACYLGPNSRVVGRISFEGDQHFYRVEALDFDAELSLDFSGAPWRVTLINWAAEQLDSYTAENGHVGFTETLGPPGSYYILVDSPTRDFDANAPYTIQASLHYPDNQVIPSVLASGNFPPNLLPGPRESFGAIVDFDGGSLHQHMQTTGTPQKPMSAPLILPASFVTVSDFTLTIDAKVESGSRAGYAVFFRANGKNLDDVVVDTYTSKIRVVSVVDGTPTVIADWTRAPVSPQGVMTRIVIRATGPSILVNINGADVVSGRDQGLGRGQIGFGAFTWGDAPSVAFNALLVTTPTEG